MKPSFACVGAHKAGTTWLYEQLVKHPEFAMPPIKEFHYFDRSESYPSPNTLSKTALKYRLQSVSWLLQSSKVILNSYRRHNLDVAKWYTKFYFSDYSDDWYLSMFDFAEGKLTGDITPSYSILNEGDVANMKSVIGEAKIVFLLRNPIERAWSTLRYNQHRGQSINLNDLKSVKHHIDSPSQELRSDYERTLDLYCKFFGTNQVLVGFYDAIESQPVELMTAILKHLGAEDFTPVSTRINAKVNASPKSDMPVAIRQYLTKKYEKPIESLSSRLGSYADLWLDSIKTTQMKNRAELSKLAPAICI